MKKLISLTIFIIYLTSCVNKDYRSEQELTAQDKKMHWWREARFGLFIHWGLYAVPAGEWNDEEIPGISEWIMARAKIPVKEYEKLAKDFNPVKYNAEEWVKLAKAAGMKYIIITSKHHDGFAMFKSNASNYNIADATPFGRDPLKELANACRKYDMKLGFYYSQAQDWHEPGGTYWNIESGEPHWDKDLVREPLMNYIEGKAVPQVKEILSNYGDIGVIWWDTPRGMTEEAAQELQAVVDEYPDLIANNRLYKPWPGDFSTPEQHVPPTGLDYDWEVCMTMNTSWGYKRNDQNWKPTKELIHMLVDIASKGGNFLLNVGPTAEGLIPDSSVTRLTEIGQWMQKNGESIYETTASPFFKLPWGRCTQRIEKRGTKLYLHVFKWPEGKGGKILVVPGIKAWIKNAYLLTASMKKLSYTFQEDNLWIHIPQDPIDPYNTVIVVETYGSPQIKSNKPALADGKILLPADFADIHNPGYGQHAIVSGTGKKSVITNWIDDRAKIEWMLDIGEPGEYKVSAEMNIIGENTLKIDVEKNPTEIQLHDTGGDFINVDLGKIQINVAGDKVLLLQPTRNNWNNVEVRKVELIKQIN